MKSMKTFIREHKITLLDNDIQWVSNNPNMDSQFPMNHFRVTLRIRDNGKRRQMTIYYSMGLGLDPDPKLADVLDCLASDSASVENARDMHDWLSEFGYDHYNPTYRQTYYTCQRQAKRLQRFIGDDYNDLLFKTDWMEAVLESIDIDKMRTDHIASLQDKLSTLTA